MLSGLLCFNDYMPEDVTFIQVCPLLMAVMLSGLLCFNDYMPEDVTFIQVCPLFNVVMLSGLLCFSDWLLEHVATHSQYVVLLLLKHMYM